MNCELGANLSLKTKDRSLKNYAADSPAPPLSAQIVMKAEEKVPVGSEGGYVIINNE